jgi:PadR family transcriptional regulator PadR
LTLYRKRDNFLSRVYRSRSMSQPTDLLQGTLDLLIMRTLAPEPMHGWGIAQRIRQMSRDVLQVQQGSLYPALHRLEQRGWIAAEWGTSDNNRRARYYRLTRAGRARLEVERSNWERLAAAVAQILEST